MLNRNLHGQQRFLIFSVHHPRSNPGVYIDIQRRKKLHGELFSQPMATHHCVCPVPQLGLGQKSIPLQID